MLSMLMGCCPQSSAAFQAPHDVHNCCAVLQPTVGNFCGHAGICSAVPMLQRTAPYDAPARRNRGPSTTLMKGTSCNKPDRAMANILVQLTCSSCAAASSCFSSLSCSSISMASAFSPASARSTAPGGTTCSKQAAASCQIAACCWPWMQWWVLLEGGCAAGCLGSCYCCCLLLHDLQPPVLQQLVG